MHTRKQALALARQLRTCPPLKIKQSLAHVDQVAAHNRICPFCTSFLKDDIEAWEIFSQQLESDFPVSGKTLPAASGQIRHLDEGLGCWRNNCFYTPPEVLILSVDGTMVLAAQVWPDVALAGPGDLILPRNMMHGISQLFIETWNIYSLEPSFLGQCSGTVSPEVVDAVLKMDKDQQFLPPWALGSIPLKENDPRIFFREIEVETGYTFASMAVPMRLAQAQAVSIPGTLESMMARIRKKIAGIDWDWVPKSKDACLAALRFPSHALSMSAADDDVKTFTAGYYSFGRDGLLDIAPVQCRIRHEVKPPEPYSVGAVIEAWDLDLSRTEFRCFIKDRQNRQLTTACKCSFNPQGSLFMAEFNRPLAPGEELVLVIVRQAG